MDRMIQPFTYEKLAQEVIKELKKSSRLSYVPDDAIIFVGANDKDTIPTFTTYLIRVSAPESGFVSKLPRIGRYYRNLYTLAIELWVKTGSTLALRSASGQPSAVKGIYEFFADVSDTLEHNTLDSQLDPLAGTSIDNPVTLTSDDGTAEGVGFMWFGTQDNVK